MEESSFSLNIVTKPTGKAKKVKKQNTYQKKQLKKQQKRHQKKTQPPPTKPKDQTQQTIQETKTHDTHPPSKPKGQTHLPPREKKTHETPVAEIKAKVEKPVLRLQPKPKSAPKPKPPPTPETIISRPSYDPTTKGTRKNPAKITTQATSFEKNPKLLDQIEGIGPVQDAPLQSSTSSHIFSNATSFDQLPIDPKIIAILQKPLDEGGKGFFHPTNIQKKAIPAILTKQDVLIKSETGSGKTLAFALPIVQQMISIKPRVERADGTHCIVLTPTRELCQQIYETLADILKPFHYIVLTRITGGEKKKSEKARLRKGVSIVIATPGRLLDHVNTTHSFQYHRLQWLVLDECDRLLDMGFEKQVTQLLEAFESKKKDSITRQNILVSATINSGVEKLASISLKDPISIDADRENGEQNANASFSTPQQLVQHFSLVPVKLRLPVLACFLRGEMTQGKACKAVVFCSTCDSVDFHYELFQRSKWPNMRTQSTEETGSSTSNFFGKCDGIYRLHGNIPQADRKVALDAFSSASSGVLFCTDVAARGLNLPTVEWIVQYDPPTEIRDYVHRVGRTARSGKEGKSLLFLLPSESAYVDYLNDHNLTVTALRMTSLITQSTKGNSEFYYSKKKEHHQVIASELQYAFEQTVLANDDLFPLAVQGFHSFVRSYATHPNVTKHIFHVRGLHFGHVARSFALRETPGSQKVKSQANLEKPRAVGSLGKRKQLQEQTKEKELKKQRLRVVKERKYHESMSEFLE